MASINISESDFSVLAAAVLDAKANGDIEQAFALDKLARKASAALTNAKYAVARNSGSATGVKPIGWEQVNSLLVIDSAIAAIN